MSAQEHIGCASNGDEHHPGDTYGFVMHPTLEPNAGAKESCRHEPHKDVEDLGRHRPLRSGDEAVIYARTRGISCAVVTHHASFENADFRSPVSEARPVGVAVDSMRISARLRNSP